MRDFFFGLVFVIMLAASTAYGHGVNYGVFDEDAIAVRFGYAGGEPMSYIEVKVFGPTSSHDLEFQNGRTDARGVFAFVPDIPGAWRVEAWDNLGHKGSIELVVEQGNAGLKSAGQTEGGGLNGGSAMVKILLALSTIINLAFVAAFIKRPKQP
jgi:nickel transport protein